MAWIKAVNVLLKEGKRYNHFLHLKVIAYYLIIPQLKISLTLWSKNGKSE